MILFDTNILVYAVNINSEQHAMCRRLMDVASSKQLNGAVFPQILLEFYAVITDKRRFARPLNVETAWQQIDAYRSFLTVIDTGFKSFELLRGISANTVGPDIFDANIKAQMKYSGITVICTYNKKDFTGDGWILPQTPEELLER
ncbi:MAG: PIN domain-containing protein [Clostridiales bacterium]|nr:PIN domain-containing protein [Clostridiales bacterium]